MNKRQYRRNRWRKLRKPITVNIGKRSPEVFAVPKAGMYRIFAQDDEIPGVFPIDSPELVLLDPFTR